MTTKRFEINNNMNLDNKIETYELSCIVDNDNKTFYFVVDSIANVESFVERLNELHEENRFLKENEKDMLDYLKKEYDYVYNQKKKHFDDAILVTSYELIEYHIRSMIEHLERL